jgi:hypothetical protein
VREACGCKFDQVDLDALLGLCFGHDDPEELFGGALPKAQHHPMQHCLPPPLDKLIAVVALTVLAEISHLLPHKRLRKCS